MEKAQYAIMRFAKYKGPEIGNIEAHNERTKEKYASNPDVDTSRSKYNFHLIKPSGKYRTESERQIAAAGCRTRKDSIRMIETLFTASPEFFKGKKRAEIRVFFEEALHFLEQHQSKETIISAVVHMDEKTPHMHLCFVPLTEDGRLSAKDIMGNKKKLTWWQDEFWKHMVKKFPDLERGESASLTGRDHIPPRVFKEMTRLTKQKDKLEASAHRNQSFQRQKPGGGNLQNFGYLSSQRGEDGHAAAEIWRGFYENSIRKQKAENEKCRTGRISCIGAEGQHPKADRRPQAAARL